MILYTFGYEDLKSAVSSFGNFECFPLFGEIKMLTSFSIFFTKISENLSTYSNYQCFQLKNTKFAISRKSAKNFEILLGLLWGN